MNFENSRPIYRLFLFVFLLSVSFLNTANATPLLRVELPTQNTQHTLLQTNPDIAYRGDNYALVVAWPEDMDALKSSGLNWSVDKENVEEFYRSRLDNSLDDMGGYLTYSEVCEWANQIITDHPDIVSSMDTVGYTLENRPIWAIKISDNPNVDEDEPELFINSAIHAREVITPMVTLNFVDLLTDGYGSDTRITDIVDNREIWIMPVVNVDGYLYNEERDPDGGGMWRKNKRVVNDEVMGVDLNRNFPAMWGQDDRGSSPYPANQTYRGESAGSEPETQVLMDFINDHEFVMILNYHSYTNIVYLPLDTNWSVPVFAESYFTISDYLTETLGWGYEWGGVSGGAIEWQENYPDFKTLAFLFEVGSADDGFWPSLERQPILIEEQEEPLLRFCELAGNPHIFIPTTPPVVEELPDTLGSQYGLHWSAGLDTLGNQASSYEILEFQNPTQSANCESEFYDPLILNGFNRSDQNSHSGNYSYFSGNDAGVITRLRSHANYQVQNNDTLSFWINYNMPPENALVIQGTNQFITAALEGNITTPWEEGGIAFGHLVFGSSEGWIEAKFPLAMFTMQTPTIVFSYFCNIGGEGTGVYIDDIAPIPSYEIINQVAIDVSDTFVVIDKTDLESHDTFYYRVRAYDMEGDISLWSNTTGTTVDPNSTDIAELETLPLDFEISELYPNPFNPTTKLTVSLPHSSKLKISVFDILGREVALYNMGKRSMGNHSFTLDGSKWTSGIYFVVVDARSKSGELMRKVAKATLVK